MPSDREPMAAESRTEKRVGEALTTTLFHCSDLHFGHPAVPAQYEAIETIIAERHYDVVAGNHDVAWWKAPLGFGNPMAMLENYRRYISEDVEPVLRIAGATIVGLNTSQGVTRRTLTWNLRDISIIGDLRRDQLERARTEFERSRAGDARAIVMHHNPVMGELSRRHGLKHTQRILGAFAEMGVDLVLCGHDHQ